MATMPVTCGQVYAGDGHLTANCTGTITITNGSLNLAGYTLFGTGLAAVDCQGACTVFGPGTVAGAGSQFGILGSASVDVSEITITGHTAAGIRTGLIGGLTVEHATITGNGIGVESTRIKMSYSDVLNNTGSGIVSTAYGVNLRRVNATGNGKHGVRTEVTAEDANRARLTDCTVNDNGEYGVIAKNVRALRSTFNDNGLGGVAADPATTDQNRVLLNDCDASGNGGSGVIGKRAKLKRTTVNENGLDGVSVEVTVDGSNRADLTDCTVNDNGQFGVIAKGIRYKATMVRSNGSHPDCGVTVPCVDLAAFTMPSYSAGSLCDTSLQIPESFTPPPPFGDPWGVCLDDF
jgi:hypothetical protein